MRTSRIYFGIAVALSLLSTIALAEQPQVTFIEDIQDPILDVTPESDTLLLDEEPVPPPIWSLCGHPSKHLLIPYLPTPLSAI